MCNPSIVRFRVIYDDFRIKGYLFSPDLLKNTIWTSTKLYCQFLYIFSVCKRRERATPFTLWDIWYVQFFSWCAFSDLCAHKCECVSAFTFMEMCGMWVCVSFQTYIFLWASFTHLFRKRYVGVFSHGVRWCARWGNPITPRAWKLL